MSDDRLSEEHFAEFYSTMAPWDIGRPQRAFVDAADQITGKVLDAGCGTGENALYFAERGREVTGVDFLEGPIDQARRKGESRNLAVDFRVLSALNLEELAGRYDSVIDCGLFHTFTDEDRPRYAAQLAGVLEPGGRLFLLCFSDQEPAGYGPRRITQGELEEAFARGWRIESLEQAPFEYRPEVEDGTFTPGGAISWFTVIRRE